MTRRIFGILAASAIATGVASAADMPVKAPIVKAPVVAPAYNWTGLYGGANIGYSWGRSRNDWNEFFPFANPPTCPPLSVPSAFEPALCINGSDSNKMNGVIGGLQAGYNWQREQFIFGIETDIQGSGQRGTQTFVTEFSTAATANGIFTASYTQKLTWLGTTRVRVGITPIDRWLLYATGGAAYGTVSSDGSATASGQCPAGSLSCPFSNWSDRSTKLGWTVGAGAERAIGNGWSLKVEYLHVDLGTVTTAFPTIAGILGNPSPLGSFAVVPANAGTITSRVTDEIARVGVNYRLN